MAEEGSEKAAAAETTETKQEAPTTSQEIATASPEPAVERVSKWRATRELFRDLRSSWKLHLFHCPASWKLIRSGFSWCCLLLVTNVVYWLFGGLLFASLEGT